MCIAIYKPAHRILSKDRLRICDINNPDGAGFAFVKDGHLNVLKGFFDFEEFWTAYNAIQENTPCLVHFRIASAGNKDAENCHPWSVTDELAIIHNGTMSDFQYKESAQSDTGNFTEEILKDLVNVVGPKFFLSPVIHYLIQKTIGDGNKMVFLDKDGDYSIVNQGKGVVEEDVWYSNESFRTLKVTQANKGGKIKETKAFINNLGSNGKQRFGYMLVGGNGELMTSQQINHLTTKVYRGKKLKKLVERGIVLRVEVDRDGKIIPQQDFPDNAAGLAMWLAMKAGGHEISTPHEVGPEILMGPIQA